MNMRKKFFDLNKSSKMLLQVRIELAVNCELLPIRFVFIFTATVIVFENLLLYSAVVKWGTASTKFEVLKLSKNYELMT